MAAIFDFLGLLTDFHGRPLSTSPFPIPTIQAEIMRCSINSQSSLYSHFSYNHLCLLQEVTYLTLDLVNKSPQILTFMVYSDFFWTENLSFKKCAFLDKINKNMVETPKQSNNNSLNIWAYGPLHLIDLWPHPHRWPLFSSVWGLPDIF